MSRGTRKSMRRGGGLFSANSVRSCRGTHLIEMGPTMWVVFIIFFFPMLVLGTLGVRYLFLINAARLAASAGAQCQTFLADVSASNMSAIDTANSVATNATAGFTGITLSQSTCYIVVTPLASGGTVTRQTTPLTKPANTSTNAYDFEVVLKAQLQPLVPATGWGFQIPGLNSAITTQARSDVFFENTQGLIQ